MNKRLIGLVLFAIAVSGIASLLVYRVLSKKLSGGGAAQVPETRLLIIARDVKMGAVLRGDDLRAAKWLGQIPNGAISSADKAEGRAAMVALHAGDLVVENVLASKGAGIGLAVKIPAGMRAVAVRVNDVVGLAGFVQPGMRVDVIAVGTPPKSSEKDTLGTQSRTVLQNIEVLSAGANIEKDVEGKPVPVQVVNLLVTPEQAETMILAGNETKVQLALRNPEDAGTPDARGTATADLFQARAARVPLRRVARYTPAGPTQPVMEKVAVPVTMEVISGTKRQEMKVGETIEERPKQEKKR